MKLLSLCLVLGAAAFWLTAKTDDRPSAQPQNDTITLQGRIFAAPDSTQTLPGTLVGVYADARYVASQMTDAAGGFEFKALPQATYEIRVFRVGFAEQSRTVKPADAPATIWIGLGSATPIIKEDKSETVVFVDGAPLPSPPPPAIIEAVEEEVAYDEADVPVTITKEEIAPMPTRDISSVAATTAGVGHPTEGEARSARGARSRREAAPKVSHLRAVEEHAKKMEVSDAEEEDRSPSDDKTTDTRQSAGQLTAGVISDHNDWDTWKDVVYKKHASHAEHWGFFPTRRYLIQLVNQQRIPLPNYTVRLQDKNGSTLWEARTDNTGRAELWYQLYQKESGKDGELSVAVTYNGFSQTLEQPKPYEKGINQMVLNVACQTSKKVDIAWVVDATGSMGDEIAYLQAELSDVINRSKSSQPDVEFTQAAVFYRDASDDYVTREHDFTDDLYEVQKFINQQQANGGGDFPEAVEDALKVAVEKLTWHDDAMTKLLFLVLDAPPHYSKQRQQNLQVLIAAAAKKGIRVIPVASSGIDKSTEYFLRAIALATNGHYTFLTNHSGIGNAHIEPTASVYRVELLNDLLVRLIEQAAQLPYCDAVPEPPVEEVLDPETSADLQLAPNPAVDVVQVTIPEGITQILITDANGRLLEQWDDLQAGNRQWQVEQYAVGMYFLHYVQDGKQQRKQLVVRGR